MLLANNLTLPGEHLHYVGSFLGRGFALLAKGHGLDRITFLFDGYYADALSESLFYNGPSSGLLRELSQIKGIKELKVEPLPEPEKLRGAMEVVKARMMEESDDRNGQVAEVSGTAQQLAVPTAAKLPELEARVAMLEYRNKQLSAMLNTERRADPL